MGNSSPFPENISRNNQKEKFSCLIIPTEMVFSLDLCKCYIFGETMSMSMPAILYDNGNSTMQFSP